MAIVGRQNQNRAPRKSIPALTVAVLIVLKKSKTTSTGIEVGFKYTSDPSYFPPATTVISILQCRTGKYC